MLRFPAFSILSIAAGAALLTVAAPAAAADHGATPSGVVRLTGAQEFPGPGDPDGTGTFAYVIRHGQLCYFLSARQVATTTAAHIHKAARGVAGGIVIGLKTPPADGRVVGCIKAVPDDQQTPGNNAMLLTKSELRDIARAPQGFYANVHTVDFPAGAIRGQLR